MRRAKFAPPREDKNWVLGPRAVFEALSAPQGLRLKRVYITPSSARAHPEIEQAAASAGVALEQCEMAKLRALAGEQRHQGVLAEAEAYAYWDLPDLLDSLRRPALVVALDELSDPRNFGAIVRSAVAFDCDGLVVPKHRSASVTPAAARSAAGATEHAKIAQVTNLNRALDSLRDEGLRIVGFDSEAEGELEHCPPHPAGDVLVVGSEGKGLRRMVRERCDLLLKISTPGPLHSLNASVAAGIAFHHFSRLRLSAGG